MVTNSQNFNDGEVTEAKMDKSEVCMCHISFFVRDNAYAQSCLIL